MFNKLKNWATRYMTKKIVSKACDLAAEQQIVYGPLVISCGRQLLLSVIEKTKQDPEVAQPGERPRRRRGILRPRIKEHHAVLQNRIVECRKLPSMKDAP